MVNKETKQKCVVKAYNKYELAQNGIAFDKLISELIFLRKLNHENIVQLIAVYETFSSLYIVYERCKGGRVINLGGFSSKILFFEIKIIATALFSLLRYLSGENIIHRNICVFFIYLFIYGMKYNSKINNKAEQHSICFKKQTVDFCEGYKTYSI